MSLGAIQNKSSAAEAVSYDNSTTSATITSTNVQGAIDQLFTSVSNGKSLIASAITDKGISTSASDSWETMAENIGGLVDSSYVQNMSQFAVGWNGWYNTTRSSSSSNYIYLTPGNRGRFSSNTNFVFFGAVGQANRYRVFFVMKLPYDFTSDFTYSTRIEDTLNARFIYEQSGGSIRLDFGAQVFGDTAFFAYPYQEP